MPHKIYIKIKLVNNLFFVMWWSNLGFFHGYATWALQTY